MTAAASTSPWWQATRSTPCRKFRPASWSAWCLFWCSTVSSSTAGRNSESRGFSSRASRDIGRRAVFRRQVERESAACRVVAKIFDGAAFGRKEWPLSRPAVQAHRRFASRQDDPRPQRAVIGEAGDALAAGRREFAGIAEERDARRSDRRDDAEGRAAAEPHRLRRAEKLSAVA